MRRLLSAVALALLGAALAHAAPAVRYRTYFVRGVRNADDVAAITSAIRALPSVEEVQGLTPKSGFVRVHFDTHTISHGQVAYAIMSARPGYTYPVTMRFSVPEYSRGDNATAVDRVLNAQSKLATIKVVDREKGLIEAKVLPFELEPAKAGPQGFHCGNLLHPIHDAPPKGLGLEFNFIGPDGKPDPLE